MWFGDWSIILSLLRTLLNSVLPLKKSRFAIFDTIIHKNMHTYNWKRHKKSSNLSFLAPGWLVEIAFVSVDSIFKLFQSFCCGIEKNRWLIVLTSFQLNTVGALFGYHCFCTLLVITLYYFCMQPEKVKFQLRLGQSKPIYTAFKAIQESPEWHSLSEAQKRIVECE